MTEKVYAHFIGVGGAGMSGLALVLHERGATVTGSDLKRSRYLNALEQAGMPVMIGHDAVNLGDPEVVVVSSAIPERNPELAEARARGIDVWPRAKMLAHLAGGRRTVAVAGSHGKTSTSSMIATIFRGMGLDPTFLIGGEIAGERTNAANGNGEYYIVEADESDGSFVYLSPHVAVITNIEIDHVDHYKSLADLEGAFAEFISRTVEGGKVVCCADDERLVQLASSTGVPLVTYGASLASDVRFFDAMPHEGGSRFSVAFPGGEEVTCTVQVPGQHMVSNATAALACAWTFGVDVTRAAAALSTFAGVR
ncbi:MAG: UDP-N-acetylmuramate--L-alanine ligase, partial [Coriobacteriia bacterium]|nr:UDP-N-acetylmuramate--L-alanine ligase [Coriobacteriia bacterium]